MPYIDKSKPSPAWTPDQLYKYQERLGIIGESLPLSPRTGMPLYTGEHYRMAYDQAAAMFPQPISGT